MPGILNYNVTIGTEQKKMSLYINEGLVARCRASQNGFIETGGGVLLGNIRDFLGDGYYFSQMPVIPPINIESNSDWTDYVGELFSNWYTLPTLATAVLESTYQLFYFNYSYYMAAAGYRDYTGGIDTPFHVYCWYSNYSIDIKFPVFDTYAISSIPNERYIVHIQFFRETKLWYASVEASPGDYENAFGLPSNYLEWFNGGYLPDPFNPYSDGGNSSEGGGNGNFSEDSGSVTADALPTASAIRTGFSTIFIPTEAQLKRLSETFWGSTIVGFFQNAITNIKDMFVSLGILPFYVTPGPTVNVTWLDIATINIPLNLATEQFIEKDLGSINMATNRFIFSSGSVLDYSPYSKLGIYLPFIGYQELNIDECRDAVIGLRYRFDILSGSCIAIISLNGNDIYQYSGNCLTQIPLTSADFSGLLGASVQVATAAASMGATAAVASAGDAVSAEMAANGKITASQLEMQNAQHAASVSNAKGSLASATANGMMGMKPNFKKTGAVSASTSLLNVLQPYLFLTTPRQSYPANYAKYCGFPSNITGKLGDFSGFTVVEDIRLNGLVATSSEVEEIYELLKSGVII